MSGEERARIVRQAKAYLAYLARGGEALIPKPARPPEKAGEDVFPEGGAQGREEPDPIRAGMAHLREEALRCVKCETLARTRKMVVFGAGNVHAELVFVGEAPGYEEDIQGLPFVGRAGQLLTKMIEAMGLRREDVFILNVLKCRPPGNRNPLPGEILNCRPYLEKQLDFMRPRVICALGNFAAQVLLGTNQSISDLRGHFHEYRGIKVLPTFHPAYLLRNPEEKRKAWEDMKTIMKELGLFKR